ncbi:LytS/YhcK type 5TM receptor domain-containing protein [Roseicyclus persicicus]|uniref:Signal transduction histidine kinase 5TM receptor LytS transmembrane region domain-containing protein n=1 Tax=Roseicyclus persicicus TaxID=2650661 RepID=A0A7X6GXN5_9RHOB|nr:LytS/YhcK type 5TM receptor domain-containing protein [Roseibacterium persicicum]NKX43027.1 hypothetical protein [Roseibacterium persicicum]
MWVDPELVLDFLSPLAVIAILAWVYGPVRHRLAGAAVAPILMGLAFGLVAVLQMHAPYRPVGGVLIDLGAVPVALAGAFLGRRGLAACLAVALAARVPLGGIGLAPDLAGLVFAGLAGFAWDRATRATVPRGTGHLVILALAMSTSLVPGLALPAPLAAWYLTHAVPILFLLHLVCVPALATLLERERHLSLLEAAARAPPR